MFHHNVVHLMKVLNYQKVGTAFLVFGPREGELLLLGDNHIIYLGDMACFKQI